MCDADRFGVEIVISEECCLRSLADNVANEYRQVAVYLSSEQALKDEKCNQKMSFAIEKKIQIIPVIKDERDAPKQVPYVIGNIQAVIWENGTPVPSRLLSAIFESFDILDKDRKIFITYKRKDATGVAYQLHDELLKKGFNVFLDEIRVVSPKNIQDEITKAIEETAFILLLHSPEMLESQWITAEIVQALESNMPIVVVQWENAKQKLPLVVTKMGPPIVSIKPPTDKDGKIDGSLDEILRKVEDEHYAGLFRRRREAVNAVKKIAKGKNMDITEYPGWYLILKDRTSKQCKIVAITPRLSCPKDLYKLDNIPIPKEDLAPAPNKILLQYSTKLPPNQNKFLTWTINKRKLKVTLGVNSIDNSLNKGSWQWLIGSPFYSDGLAGSSVFMSASFPYGDRANKFPEANPFEITSAVVALARSVFGAKGKLVFGGHPTISPLVLSVARDFTLFCANQEVKLDRPLVYIYQSKLFEDVIPKETLQLEEEGIGEIIWVNAEGTDKERSLLKMRVNMLSDSKLLAGVSIGGMNGVYDIDNKQYNDEFYLFTKHCNGKPFYPIGSTGGASQALLKAFLKNPKMMKSWKYAVLKPDELGQPTPYSVLTKQIVLDIIENKRNSNSRVFYPYNRW
jgi:hypothetical protein